MKLRMLLSVMLLSSISVSANLYPSYLKCPVCVQRGYKTVVTEGANFTTLLASYPYYDENGKYHFNNPNVTTTSFSCASGHTFSVSSSLNTNTVSVTSSNDICHIGLVGTNFIDSISCNSLTNVSWVTHTNVMHRSLFNDVILTNLYNNSTAITIYGVTFEQRDDVLIVDTHGKSMNEAGTNLFEFVIERFKKEGYKLTK